jgi:coenzyme Q-binding protein COQ10
MPTHTERRNLAHTPKQLFDLVADIEKYPEFLPWCVAARIRKRDGDRILADLVIGYKMFRERFTSQVTLSAPGRIDVTYSEGPFKYLNNHWIFAEGVDDGCDIDFFVDFELRSRLLEKIIGVVFNEAIQRMVSAFERRADDLYGSGEQST